MKLFCTKRTRAFTLMELLIVIAIMAVIAATFVSLAPFIDTRVEVAHGLIAVDRFALFFKALFLIDRDGIVRWADIECEQEGLAGLGKLASEEAILDAARACAA